MYGCFSRLFNMLVEDVLGEPSAPGLFCAKAPLDFGDSGATLVLGGNQSQLDRMITKFTRGKATRVLFVDPFVGHMYQPAADTVKGDALCDEAANLLNTMFEGFMYAAFPLSKHISPFTLTGSFFS